MDSLDDEHWLVRTATEEAEQEIFVIDPVIFSATRITSNEVFDGWPGKPKKRDETMRRFVRTFATVFVVTLLAIPTTRATEHIDELIEALNHPNSAARLDAARALRSLGPAAAEAVPALIKSLIKSLGAPEDERRRAAARALGAIGPATKDAVPALIEALNDPDPQTREEAVKALGEMGPAAAAAVPALIAALADVFVTVEAAEALGEIGLVAVPALIEALRHSDPNVRMAAARALGAIAPAAKDAVPALIEALGDEDFVLRLGPVDELVSYWVREAASRALRKITRASR